MLAVFDSLGIVEPVMVDRTELVVQELKIPTCIVGSTCNLHLPTKCWLR